MSTKAIAEHTIMGSPRLFASGSHVLATAAVIGSGLSRLAIDRLRMHQAPLLVRVCRRVVPAKWLFTTRAELACAGLRVVSLLLTFHHHPHTCEWASVGGII
jgi:hypothetical protein